MSPVTKEQWVKIFKAACYVVASALISFFIAQITNDPSLFGPLTPIINIVLVSVKQLFTKE